MDQKSDLIKEDIDETRAHLTHKLVTLEEELRDKVETAKSAVEDTIDNVRATVRQFSPTYQTEEHPLLMLGGSVAAGFLVGRWLTPRSPRYRSGFGMEGFSESGTEIAHDESQPQTSPYEGSWVGSGKSDTTSRRHTEGPSFFAKLADQFSDEIDMVKGMALGALFNVAKDSAKKALPNLGSQIDQVLDSAMRKVGADRSVGRPADEETRGNVSDIGRKDRFSSSAESEGTKAL